MLCRILIGILFSPLLVAGQTLEFNDPRPLPSNVNSESPELMPLLFPNGRVMTFTRSMSMQNLGGQYAGQDIWVTEPLESGWKRATNTFYSFNSKGNDVIIGVNRSGNGLYLMKTISNRKVKGVFFTKKINDKWSVPELILVDGLESVGSLGFFMHPDEDVLLISMQASGGYGGEDIYISFKDSNGVWSKAKNIGVVINTSGSEISPFLSENKSKLYFASNGHDGLGDWDIFVSDRLHNSWDTWSIPRNLGPKINSTGFDAYFSIYGDTLAYFSSDRSGKSTDIFETRIVKATQKNSDIRYLTDSEVSRYFGSQYQPEITFEEDNDLSELSRRQLRKVCSVLASEVNVKLQIQVVRSAQVEVTDVYQARLLKILDFLRSNGISGDRITFGTEIVDVPDNSQPKDMVRIRFYK